MSLDSMEVGEMKKTLKWAISNDFEKIKKIFNNIRLYKGFQPPEHADKKPPNPPNCGSSAMSEIRRVVWENAEEKLLCAMMPAIREIDSGCIEEFIENVNKCFEGRYPYRFEFDKVTNEDTGYDIHLMAGVLSICSSADRRF